MISISTSMLRQLAVLGAFILFLRLRGEKLTAADVGQTEKIAI